MNFPFSDWNDQEIEEHIAIAKKEIDGMVRRREFDNHILAMGKTLIDLETEKSIRSSAKH